MKHLQAVPETAQAPGNSLEWLPSLVTDHILLFREWADGLDGKCRSCNQARQWRSRGERDTLRRVARHLRAMRTTYLAPQALHNALTDYLACLEVSIEEAREEAHGSRLCRRSIIERWKAEGEGRALPGICAALRRLLRGSRRPIFSANAPRPCASAGRGRRRNRRSRASHR